ncbi:MAG: hypothetical protein P1Q69_07005 [Candidatus Thorarchaeota archaeon]|nr:hypothetical protein [Candidatus Thorarchaeota archaeon]
MLQSELVVVNKISYKGVDKEMTQQNENNHVTSLHEIVGATFKARISGATEVKKFKALINGNAALLRDYEIFASQQGIRVRALDSSKACMVDWEIKSKFFESYEFDSSFPEIAICVTADDINHSIDRAVDVIELTLLPRSGEPVLQILSEGKVNKKENLRLLPPMAEKVRMVSLTPESTCMIQAEELIQNIRQLFKAKTNIYRMSIWSIRNEVQISENKHGEPVIYPRGLVIEGKNDESEIFLEMPGGQPDEYSVWSIYSKYGFDKVCINTSYIREFIKFFYKADDVKVCISLHRPIVFEVNDPDGRIVRLIQAPMVESWEVKEREGREE